ncbi:MAG: ribosome maturation factor RimM [Acidimicrobiales bacterium]
MGTDLPEPESTLSVGHVRKAHGLRGEVVVRLSSNRTERVAPGAILWTDGGKLTVSSSRPHDADHLVLFEGVTGREGADALRATELRGEAIDDPDELWVHELIGATVVDSTGVERGHVLEVESNPASDLLVLDSGALVPVRFVTEHSVGKITVDTPDGLFEL